MKIIIKTLQEKIEVDIGTNKYQIKDTIDDWLILDSSDRVLAISSKFNTEYIIFQGN